MTTERKQLYGGRKPKDYLPAHNHVTHTAEFFHGQNGFRRFWIPPEWVEGGEWSECPCGWRGHDPKWRTHYAVRRHAAHWKAALKKHGSLEAVYRQIRSLLQRSGHHP
jgi:hypothetical protein